MRRAKHRRGSARAQRALRTLHREWAIDTAVPKGGNAGWWALVDAKGRTRATGKVTTRASPASSVEAEARAVRDALPHVPEGATLRTDCLALVEATQATHRRGEIDGLAGAVADAVRARSVRLKWARRTTAALRAAHDAAQRRARDAREGRGRGRASSEKEEPGKAHATAREREAVNAPDLGGTRDGGRER